MELLVALFANIRVHTASDFLNTQRGKTISIENQILSAKKHKFSIPAGAEPKLNPAMSLSSTEWISWVLTNQTSHDQPLGIKCTYQKKKKRKENSQRGDL